MSKPRVVLTVSVKSKDGRPVHAAGWAELNWVPLNAGDEIDETAHVYTINEFQVMHGNGSISWPALFKKK